jgi:hypothetical protein
MFANNEITNRGLLHRMLAKAATEVTMDDRTVWARSIDRAIKDAARPARSLRFRIARPVVVLAAASELSAVAAILRDETATVSLEALAAVRAFMTDGIDSPLYGQDPLAARRGAEQLRRVFVTPQQATERSEAYGTKQSARHPTAA